MNSTTVAVLITGLGIYIGWYAYSASLCECMPPVPENPPLQTEHYRDAAPFPMGSQMPWNDGWACWDLGPQLCETD